MKILYHKAILLNRYCRITKFYSFLKDIALKGGITIIVAVSLILLLDYYFFDLNALLELLVTNFSKGVILLVFFLSEVFLGLLPPEVFIAWSSKLASPWTTLFLIALLSYLGGICAYFIGKQLFRIPSIHKYVEEKVAIHINNLRKWGGFLVFVGAMLPIPHSIVSMACGLINYRFSHYLLWALFRFLRFAIYGSVIFEVI